MTLPVRWTMGGVFAVLVAAGATTSTLGRLRPGMDLAEVRLRIRSWWAMAAVFVAALVIDRMVTAAFLTAVGLIAVLELARVTRTVAVPVAIAATLAGYAAAMTGRPDLLPLVVVAAAAATAIELVLRGVTHGFVAQVGSTTVAVGVGVALSHMVALLMLPTTGPRGAGGSVALLWLVVVAQGGDVAQFLTGKAFGRSRLAPEVSPHKTVAGLVGGFLVSSALGAGLGVFLLGSAWPRGALLGAAVAGVGALGDLVVSAVKRDCGVKDMGTLIPGHGGVLDRVDSLVLAAPLVFWVVA